MTQDRTLDVSHLPDYEISSRSPLWWGQLLMCVIEGCLFCTLIAIYFYLRLRLDVWPPPGVRLPPITISTLAIVPLLLSCIGSYWASEAAKKEDRKGMIRGMGLNLGLGVVFVILRALEWSRLNFTWASDVHGSIVWAILFIHTYDVIVDLLLTTALLVIVIAGRDGPRQRVAVHADGALWYFLVAIWLPMYVAIVWSPHMGGAPR